MINTTSLVGRLTKDVNFMVSQSDIPVANCTIAVNRPFKGKDGERQADFINFVAFRKTAEILSQYTKKGDQIGISGRLQSRTYENNQGATVFVTELVVDNVALLEPNDNKQNNQNQQQGGYQPPQQQQNQGGYNQQPQQSRPMNQGNHQQGNYRNPNNYNQPPQQNQNNYRPPNQQQPQQNNPYNPNAPVDISDDDLPF